MAQGRGEGAGDVSSLTAAVAEAAQDLGRWRRPLSLRVPARAHSHVHTHTRAPSPGVLAGPLGPGSSVACCSLLCRTTVGPNRWWPEAPGPALTQGHSRPSPGHRPCNGGSVPSAPDPLCGSVTGLDPSGSPPPASPGCSRAPAVRARCAVNPQRGRGGGSGQPVCLSVRPPGVSAPAHALGHGQPGSTSSLSHTPRHPEARSGPAAPGTRRGGRAVPRGCCHRSVTALSPRRGCQQSSLSLALGLLGGGICREVGSGVVCQAGPLESPLSARSPPRPGPAEGRKMSQTALLSSQPPRRPPAPRGRRARPPARGGGVRPFPLQHGRFGLEPKCLYFERNNQPFYFQDRWETAIKPRDLSWRRCVQGCPSLLRFLLTAE